MTERMIAFCGIICTECDAYKATQSNDPVWLEQVVEKTKKDFNIAELSVDQIACDGCLQNEGKLCNYCSECEIRQCGQEKGVANCGVCAEYESCQRVQAFFSFAPNSKAVLDEIHANTTF